jgi:trans-aconitate 2-methyltransferase
MKQATDWNPELYLKFGNERTQPSIDLVNRIQLDKQPENIIDIGCGPGNSGQVLISRWPNAKLLGIDSSEAMIAQAKKDYPRQEWIVSDALKFISPIKFDVVFSNATIQWIPDHEKLLNGFCSLLSDNGVLAFQAPMFNHMPIRQAIAKVARESRWKSKLENCASVFTFHEAGFYYDLLSPRLSSLELWETYYLHVLESHEAIIDWIQSTGMKPYLDSLSGENEKSDFRTEALNEVKKDYPAQKNGKVIFPFRRLFVIGYKRTSLKST